MVSLPRPLLVLLLPLVCISCHGDGAEETPAETRKPVSLVQSWAEVRLDHETPAPRAEPSSDVRFDGSIPGLRWRAVDGIENLRLEDGRLLGRTTSDKPVLLVELPDPLGNGDELWSAGLRVETSGGTRAGVHPLGDDGPPLPVVVARADAWPASTPLPPDAGEPRSYRVELDDVFLLEMPPALSNFRRIAVRPTNQAGADFAVDALHLTFRRQHLAGISSGPGWHGLGEVFRETLVSRAPETLTFRVDLPARPWLGLSLGSVEKTPPVFKVLVAPADGEAPPQELASFTVDGPEIWRSERLDLGPWAGRTVDLVLAAESERPGALAFWGAPTIRDALPARDDTADAKTAQRPRAVVVFLIDTLRSDRLDAWGHDRETAPTLTRLTAEGSRFADAVSQATWTKASVPSLLTSLYPSTTGVVSLNDRLSAAETTLAEAFRDAGYATFSTSSVPFSGQLTRLHQGVEVLHEFGAVESSAEGYQSKTGRYWVDRYLDWLEMHRDVPTFALIHAMDPHSPFRPEAPFDTLWASAEDAERFAEEAERVGPQIKHPLMRRFLAPSREELETAGVDPESFVHHELAWYDGSIRALDDHLARLVERLEAPSLADRSLIAVVADHGEEFLEHGQHWHGHTVYGEVANVPMVFWGAGVPAGRVVEETVQNVDLLPTLLDLASIPVPERAQGRSLVPLMTGEGAGGRTVPAFTESHLRPENPRGFARFAMVEERFKLVWNVDAGDLAPEYELYDHDADPLNAVDLAAEHPEVVERMAEDLRRWKSWAEGRRLDEAAATAEISAEELEQLRSLGYVE